MSIRFCEFVMLNEQIFVWHASKMNTIIVDPLVEEEPVIDIE